MAMMTMLATVRAMVDMGAKAAVATGMAGRVVVELAAVEMAAAADTRADQQPAVATACRAEAAAMVPLAVVVVERALAAAD